MPEDPDISSLSPIAAAGGSTMDDEEDDMIGFDESFNGMMPHSRIEQTWGEHQDAQHSQTKSGDDSHNRGTSSSQAACSESALDDIHTARI